MHRFPAELIHLIEGLALRRPPPSAASIHRQVSTIAQERGWSVPSCSAVYALIHSLDPGLVTLAHDGPKAYRERFFETVNQLFLCELPGYTPAGSPKAEPRLSLEELGQRLHTFLLENYHQRRHSETKMAPLARWEAGGFLPRMPEALEQLDLLLLTVAKGRKVQQDGIHFQGLRYMVACEPRNQDASVLRGNGNRAVGERAPAEQLTEERSEAVSLMGVASLSRFSYGCGAQWS